MKYLWLARHAKSDWGDGSLKDFDRPLNDRGLRDAPAMGRWLVNKGVKPDVMVTSPAKRALQTAELLADGMGFSKAFVFHEPRIYEAHTGELQEIIEESDNGFDHLMLVGHNPAMTQLVNALGGGPLDNLPTCAIAALTYDVTRWVEVETTLPVSAEIWRPKELL
ncbi:MAG: SixA phosphatase family protein [Nevskiales bacterium]